MFASSKFGNLQGYHANPLRLCERRLRRRGGLGYGTLTRLLDARGKEHDERKREQRAGADSCVLRACVSGALRAFCLLIADEVRCHIEREHGSARSVLPVRCAVVALDLQSGVHRVDHARVTDGSNAAEVVRQMGGEATTHVLVE
jgi:hypothetical protein